MSIVAQTPIPTLSWFLTISLAWFPNPPKVLTEYPLIGLFVTRKKVGTIYHEMAICSKDLKSFWLFIWWPIIVKDLPNLFMINQGITNNICQILRGFWKYDPKLIWFYRASYVEIHPKTVTFSKVQGIPYLQPRHISIIWFQTKKRACKEMFRS
mgnify:CR=1 FL=1